MSLMPVTSPLTLIMMVSLISWSALLAHAASAESKDNKVIEVMMDLEVSRAFRDLLVLREFQER